MHIISLVVLASANGVFANQISSLNKRQGTIPCRDLGMKTCGNVCIDITDTCCPDGSGGCRLGNYCVIGDNGEYGCCPLGEICVGDGGASTDFGTITSTIVDTQTLPPPEEPTTAPEPEEPEPEPETPEEEEPPAEEETPVVPEPEVPEETIPPVPLPTPIPSNGTGLPTTTSEPPVVTDAAGINGLAVSNLLGGLVAAAALLF